MRIREDELIERIRRRIPSLAGGVLRVGIGDDAAVLRPSVRTDWILTCDQFIEGVHFLGGVHPPEVVGYKALARAASDAAAMGAWPRLFLLSMTLPSRQTARWLERMLDGMSQAARHLGLRLAGGDTAKSSSSRGGAALSITVLSEIKSGHAVLRHRARPGDTVFVTGRLGAAQLGLELVLRGMHRQRRWRHLLAPHYYPKIHVQLGHWLATRRLASAMMDLSDGLSTDLHRLCRASGVGARVYAEKLPCVAVPKPLGTPRWNDLALALHGGEDYSLLFTVRQRWIRRIPRIFHAVRLTRIGEIVHGRKVELVETNGHASLLPPQGWDHFRKQ